MRFLAVPREVYFISSKYVALHTTCHENNLCNTSVYKPYNESLYQHILNNFPKKSFVHFYSFIFFNRNFVFLIHLNFRTLFCVVTKKGVILLAIKREIFFKHYQEMRLVEHNYQFRIQLSVCNMNFEHL